MFASHRAPSPSTAVEPLLRRKVFSFFNKLAGYLDRRGRLVCDLACAAHLRARYGRHVGYVTLDTFEADYAERWSRIDTRAKRLSIVVVTYRQPAALDAMLASLRCQTLQNFEVTVYHDGPDDATRELVARYAAEEPGVYSYVESSQRFADWGHSLRSRGLCEASCEYVLITNGDNYYAPRFVEYAFEAIDARRVDVLLFDMVHSHPNAGVKRAPPNFPLRTFPFRFHCDIGAFVVRTSLAQRAGFNDRSHAADATYLEDVLRTNAESIAVAKVNRTLFVHN